MYAHTYINEWVISTFLPLINSNAMSILVHFLGPMLLGLVYSKAKLLVFSFTSYLLLLFLSGYVNFTLTSNTSTFCWCDVVSFQFTSLISSKGEHLFTDYALAYSSFRNCLFISFAPHTSLLFSCYWVVFVALHYIYSGY